MNALSKNPTSSLSRGGLALAAALILTAVSPVAAVDPLPPELENAPLQEQIAWRTRNGLDAQKQKEQVAQERYAQRSAFKESLLAQLNQEANDRVESIASPLQAAIQQSEQKPSSTWTFILVLLLTAGFGFVFVRRFILPANRRL